MGDKRMRVLSQGVAMFRLEWENEPSVFSSLEVSSPLTSSLGTKHFSERIFCDNSLTFSMS